MSKTKIIPFKIGSRIKISRDVGSGTFRFIEIFNGFESVDVVKNVFGEKTRDVLKNLKVEVFPKDGYMGVSDEDGHIFASELYLRQGEEWCVYLDVIHELVHVRQFMEGKDLFDRSYSYVDRPTEIEAYRIAAEEARRIGLSETGIFDYLKVPWITKKEHIRLALACNISQNVFLKPVKIKKSERGRDIGMDDASKA